MSDRPPVLGVVVGHGQLGQGLVDAARRIAGDEGADALVAVSNTGLTAEALCERLEERIGGRDTVIFTDLQTGSCAMTGRLLCRNSERRAVVFGVNLAILLDFIFHRDLPLEELVPRLLSKGREAVSGIPGTLSDADPPAQS